MTAIRAKKHKTATTSGHTLDGPIPGLVHHCFGCSKENRTGLHLRFKETDNGGVVSELRVPRRFEGPPGHVHGGIIATILDEAMGKVNRRKGIVALTRHMSIDYLRPVPLATKLRAVGWSVKEEGRKHFHTGEIRAMDGTVLARAHGVFIAVNSAELFEKYKQRLTFSAANR
ncbi:MAG TPA: PaaI family thioesterase [Acidobacteriaceae bacterium]|nr:PaaI family thioesterase [Acidobacteriaceae bacterium]